MLLFSENVPDVLLVPNIANKGDTAAERSEVLVYDSIPCELNIFFIVFSLDWSCVTYTSFQRNIFTTPFCYNITTSSICIFSLSLTSIILNHA